MAVPLDTLVTHRPAISAVFLCKEDELPETIGQYLFIHHALWAICPDAGLDSPEEQIRGMAMGIWDGLSDRNKIFWTERAATARLVRDREDFLLTDGSTSLAKDHEERTRAAVAEFKRSVMSDNISVADTASIADTELTEETLDELDALETDAYAIDEENAEELIEVVKSTPAENDRTSASATAFDAPHGKSDDSNDSNGAESDRELRALQKSDTADALLNLETPATSIESLPPAEAESYESHAAGAPEKDDAATADSKDVEARISRPSRPESAADTTDDLGLISKIASAASSVPAWIAQSLDWAEESQEQADREAAAQPESAVQETSSEVPHVGVMAPESEDADPEEVPTKVLWIGSLRRTVTVPLLKATFAKFGRIESAKVMPGKACGFVHFADVESAIAAKRGMNGQRIINARDPLLIKFAEDRSRNGPPPGSKNESPQPGREHPTVASGNSVRSASIEDNTDWSDNRSVTTTTSEDTRSTSQPNGFSAAQLEEARRFASKATRGGKPPKGKPVTLSVAVEKQAQKVKGAAPVRKGRMASGESGASTPIPRTPREDYTPVSTPPAEKVPLAKWEEPVKVRDFGAKTSIEPESVDDGGKGKDFFLFHALPIVCEDLEIDEPDDYAQSIAFGMWTDLTPEVKKSWIEDSRSLRGYSMRKPGLLPAQKRFKDSHFTKDYRSQILKALAVRKNGELKYLQPEFKRLMLTERRRRRQEREREKRQLQHAAEKQSEAEESKQTAAIAKKDSESGERKPNPTTLRPVQADIEPELVTPAIALLDEKKIPVEQHRTSTPAATENVAPQTDPTSDPPPPYESGRIAAAPLLPAVTDTLAPQVTSVSEPPSPYESDSAAAASSSEATTNEWQVVGQKPKSSAKDTAKRVMKNLTWSKVAKG